MQCHEPGWTKCDEDEADFNFCLQFLHSRVDDEISVEFSSVVNEGLILNVFLIFSFVLQNVVPAEVSLVCVVKPDEFWDKKVTHFCFWKEKDRLGFEVC